MSRHHQRRPVKSKIEPLTRSEVAAAETITGFNWSKIFQTAIIFFFHLLLITTPFFFTWVNEELFEFNKMLLVYGISAIIGGLWIARSIVDKEILFKKNPLNLALGLFLVSQILSTIFSIHPYTSVFGYYTRFHGGLLSTLSYYVLLFAFINNVEKKHLAGIFISTFAAALGVSLYALPEHFGHSPSCLLILANNEAAANGWQKFWSQFFANPYLFFNVDCWVQDVQNRIFGTFGQPNWLAAYAITLIPVGIALTLNQTKNKIKPIFYLVTTILLFIVLLFTKSRSGILGLGIGLLIFSLGFIILYLQNRQITKTQNSLNIVSLNRISYLIILIFVLSFLTSSLIFGTPYSPSFSQIKSKYFSPPTAQQTAPLPENQTNNNLPVNRLEAGGTDSGEIRIIVWAGAFKIWQRYPLLGSGVETFAYSYYQDRPMAHNNVSEWDFLYNKAHNEFLNYLATTGIVGLVTYCLLLGSFLFFCSYFVFRHSSQLNFNDSLLILSLACGIIGLSISNFLGFSTVMVTVLMYLFMGILIVMTQEKNESLLTTSTRPTKSTIEPISSSDWLSISILAMVVVYLLFIIFSWWQADYFYNQGDNLSKAGQLVEAAKSLEIAASKSSNEALFYDKLADTYGQLAVALAENKQASLAGQVVQEAIKTSDKTMELNPVHLNFYKSRAHLYIILAQLNPKFLDEAVTTLQKAQTLAPTDTKILYNLALILIEQGKADQGTKILEQVIVMKPNYDAARFSLGQQYEKQGKTEFAKDQYRYILENINPNSDNVRQRLENLEK
jgi:Flp pilus assembly protein TadD